MAEIIPTPKQIDLITEVFVNRKDFILYGGAIKGTKSFGLMIVALMLLKKYPGSRFLFVRKDRITIRQNTIPTWDKIKPLCKHEDAQMLIYTLRNGSQMIFFGENYDTDKDLNRWRGLDINWVGFDEINECQEVSFYKAFERAGSYLIPGMAKEKQPKPQVFASCNPTRGWVKEKIYDKYVNGTLPPNWCYIPAKITDNPYLPESYLESLKNLPKYEYETFVEGNWDIQAKTGGEFLKQFDLDKHARPIFYNKDLPICVFVDKNYLPYIAIQIWQMEGKTLKLIDEIPCKPPNNSAEKAAVRLVQWAKDHEYKDVISIGGDYGITNHSTEDAENKSFLDIFAGEISKSFKRRLIVKPNPPVATSAGFMNAIFEGKVEGCQIVVNENCKETINDWIVTKEKMDGTMVKEKETVNGQTYEKNGHFTDLGRYAAFTLLPQEFVRYQNRFAGSGRTIMGKNYHASSY